MIEQVEEVLGGLSARLPARRALAPAAEGRPSVQIVGRTRELQLMETLLDTIRPGYPTVLHLSGPGGIGKTILLSHLVDRAANCGYLTLRGRAAEFGTKEAFGLFYDALEPALASLDPRALRRLDEEQQTELAGVFPALKDHSDGHRLGPASGSMDRYRLHRAVAALIDLLASGRPVLLAVDDLHWADPASVELLLYLLRRPPVTPLLAAVASRSSQLQPEAAALLEDIHRDSRGIALELAPLTAREAAALFPSDLPTVLAERIYTESGGNPFFLMELMRAAHSDEIDAARPVAIEDGHVPATVTSAIARECNRVSPTARELIMAAALLGDAFEPELAGEIVSVEQSSALRALDELLRSELVQVADVPGSFRFRHPIVRRAVYDAAGGGWRRAAHARAASILAERGAPAAARAGHVELSATLGDGAAIAVLSEAGYASAPRAPAAAAGWFGTALRLLGDRRDDAQRLELTLAMALALGSAGKLRESRNAFQEVWALLPPDSALRGRAVGAAALIEHLLGKHDEAQALLLSHLPGLDDGDSATAELMLEIAEGCFFSADWDGMRYWAQKAEAVAGLSPIVRAGANASLSLAAYGVEDVGDGAPRCTTGRRRRGWPVRSRLGRAVAVGPRAGLGGVLCRELRRGRAPHEPRPRGVPDDRSGAPLHRDACGPSNEQPRPRQAQRRCRAGGNGDRHIAAVGEPAVPHVGAHDSQHGRGSRR